MRFEEIIAFLKGSRFAVVSSVASDGRPQSAVVGIATTSAGEVVFDTLGEANKARNLRRDPRVSITVWEGERTVQLEGRADEPDGAERHELVELYLRSWPDGRARLAWPGITHFRVVPHWIRWSDFSTEPGPTIVVLSRRGPGEAFDVTGP